MALKICACSSSAIAESARLILQNPAQPISASFEDD
jgi:hypothetical protein